MQQRLNLCVGEYSSGYVDQLTDAGTGEALHILDSWTTPDQPATRYMGADAISQLIKTLNHY